MLSPFQSPKGIWNVAHYQYVQERCGYSGLISKLKVERLMNCQYLYSRNLLSHYGCVNALEFSNGTQEMLASGGDDKRVLLWNLNEALFKPDYKPAAMIGSHMSNIFCIAFDVQNRKLLSSGNDEQVLVHDISTMQIVNVYWRDDAVYSLSAHPNDDNIFASASEDGKIRLTDMRASNHSGTVCLANYDSAFHGVAFNPMEPMLVASAHSKEGIGLWDVRKPKNILLRYGEPYAQESAMSVRFNGVGSRLVALRRRRSPRLYKTHDATPVIDCSGEGYLNSCTMKSGCFAGENDEYIVSGSDNFKVYVWKIPEEADGRSHLNSETPKMILQGHRSIVNQVRYNKEVQTLASSGVEKSVKLWSPFHYPGFGGGIEQPSDGTTRSLYSRHQYIDLMVESGISLTHDYETGDTVEDPRMMAFFDSLLQHDRNNSSDSSSDDQDSNIRFLPAIMESSRHQDRLDAVDISSDSSDSNDEQLPGDYFSISSLLSSSIHDFLVNERTERSDNIRESLSRLQSLRDSIQRDTESEISDVIGPMPAKSNANLSDNTGTADPTTSRNMSPRNLSCNDSGVVFEVQPSKSHETDNAETIVGPKSDKTRTGKCLKRKQSEEGDSGCEGHSSTRKRNAARKIRCRKKWVVHSDDTHVNEASTPPTPASTATSGLTVRNTANTVGDKNNNKTVEGEVSTSAYERSLVKLQLSVEATDLRLANIADELATALETDDACTNDSNDLPTTSNGGEVSSIVSDVIDKFDESKQKR